MDELAKIACKMKAEEIRGVTIDTEAIEKGRRKEWAQGRCTQRGRGGEKMQH